MRFNRIRMNLPCMVDYDPRMPKVMRWDDNSRIERGVGSGDRENGNGSGGVAGDFVTFIDDCRLIGSSKEHCHEVHRQYSGRVQFLGMQDAPRKFRPPSQNQAGAWTGTIFRISKKSITKSVSQAKWDKGRAIVLSWHSKCKEHASGRPTLDRKELESETGFLNHLTMTFDDAIPFLKGLYLTLNSWRPHRDGDDWKMADKRWKNERGLPGGGDVDICDEKAPATVVGSPRLSSDVAALVAIFAPTTAPLVNIRSSRVLTVIYGFGDASGTGLGSTFTCGNGFNFRIGVWGSLEKDESSNWKEFSNVVDALEDEATSGKLQDTEVFMFTDNATVEACSTKGSSSSPKLLGLIIRLKALSTGFGFKLHIFHVAGTRMIAQGTDGVSRGNLATGIMAGEAMSSFIPIHKNALERSPGLVSWIKEWAGDGAIILEPIDWFGTGHDINGWVRGADGFERPQLAEERTYIWLPPPFAADIAVAELRKARIKRQTLTHVFVCPRLCCPLWLKQLYKASDVVLEFRAGSCLPWGTCMHEPVLIGLLFPFLRFSPWQLRNTPKMHAMGRQLRGLLEGEDVDPCGLLRKFWEQCHRLGNMQEAVVRKVLYFRGEPRVFSSWWRTGSNRR